MSQRRDFIKIPPAVAVAGVMSLSGQPSIAGTEHFADGGSFDPVCTRK